MEATVARTFAAPNESGKKPTTEIGHEWHGAFNAGYRVWTQGK
jgi:hypothetical protein